MPNLYVLLVGINEYHPQSGVRNLRGCENDVKFMEGFLKNTFSKLLPRPDEQIKKILNKDATRENLLKTFQSHFTQAKAGDFALFYYSGHGSYEQTSQEFEYMDVEKQNETIVCHDSRLPDGEDLADKELAVLISRIPEGVQKIMILDSCHSGSATRSAEEGDVLLKRHQPSKRFSGSGSVGRPLESYLLPGDNFYLSQKGSAAIDVPSSPHVVISGCSRKQTALETREARGLFSTHLLKVLENNQGQVSYNDLFLQVRSSVLQDREDQTPQVEPFNGFNANLRFLSHEPADSPTYPVRFLKNKGVWEMDMGAVHGLPTDPNDINQIEVMLHPEGPGKLDRSKGITASVQEVKVDKSWITSKDADTSVTYKAEIIGLPPLMAMRVYLNGSEGDVKKFHSLYKNVPSAYLEMVDTSKGTDYELRVKDNKLKIYHIPSGKFILGADGFDNWAVEEIVKALNQIEKWERIGQLEKSASILSEDEFIIKCQQIDQTGNVLYDFPGRQITLELDKQSGRWGAAGLKFEAQNKTNEKLYVILLYMNRFFEIKFMKKSVLESGSDPETLFANGLTIGDPEVTEIVDTFKILVSTEDINPAFFTQDKLPVGEMISRNRDLTKDVASGWGAAPVVDWFVKTYQVTISGNLREVGTKDVSTNGIKIKSHPKMKAKLTFAPVNSHTRSVDDINRLPDLLKGSGINMIDFSQERSDSDKSVIVLSDITDEDSLKENPLEIELEDPIGENEMIVPVTYDGEFVLPFGDVTKDGQNRTTISIDQLPAQPEDNRRSVGRALKFTILRTALGDNAKVFQLRRVDYDTEGEEKRTTLDVKEKVAEASKILLLVHGIIGDTVVMAQEAEFAVKDSDFDLVLTFDYENLSTPIDKISEKLNEELEKAGLGANDGKTLHIVAHSMGGLVSRYMIEKIRGGDDMVDRLVMFGTPNGGSRFGMLPEVVKPLKYLLGFALNFLPGHVKSVLEKIKELASPHAPEIFKTLKMMDTDSDFIKELGANPSPSTEYYIVAGDITNFIQNTEEGKWVGRLMEKLILSAGKLVYFGEANDIAVSTSGIKQVNFVDTANAKVVPCHHLNYFVHEKSVEMWKEWI